MWKKIKAWIAPTVEEIPVRRDPVAVANERLIAVTARLPVVLGEDRG